MKRMCRETVAQEGSKQQLALTELLHHARIVTDPERLEYLKARVLKRKTIPVSLSLCRQISCHQRALTVRVNAKHSAKLP